MLNDSDEVTHFRTFQEVTVATQIVDQPKISIRCKLITLITSNLPWLPVPTMMKYPTPRKFLTVCMNRNCLIQNLQQVPKAKQE